MPEGLWLAQQQGASPEEIALVIGVILGYVFVALAIQVFVLWLIYAPLSAIPAQYRSIEPTLVWVGLLGICCFLISWAWNFVLYLQVPDSFQRFFRAHGRGEHGDCGRGIGIAAAISSVCLILPYVNMLILPASFVLHIVVWVKFWTMKRAVEEILATSGDVHDDDSYYDADDYAPENVM